MRFSRKCTAQLISSLAVNLIEIYLIGVQIEIYLFWCSCLNSVHTARRAPVIIKNTIPAAHTHTQLFQQQQLKFVFFFVRPVSDRRRILLFQVEGRGWGIHISLAAILEGIHISLVICAWGYTYHCDED